MPNSNEYDLSVLKEELKQVDKIIGEITEKADELEKHRKKMTTLETSFRWVIKSIEKDGVQIPLDLDTSSSS